MQTHNLSFMDKSKALRGQCRHLHRHKRAPI